jgi:anti-sigma B factor antagonist
MTHPHLDIDVDRQPTATVVTLSGELDLATATRLESALDRLTAEDLVLDLRPLTYLDSTGVRLLLRHDAAARSSGRRMRVIRGQGVADRVFALTDADRLLQVA